MITFCSSFLAAVTWHDGHKREENAPERVLQRLWEQLRQLQDQLTALVA